MLDISRGSVDDLGEADGQLVELGQAARHVVMARFLRYQFIELAAGKRLDVCGQRFTRLHVVQRAVDVVAELRPMGRACDKHGVFAAQVLRCAVRNGGVRIKQVVVLVEHLFDGAQAFAVVDAVGGEVLAHALERFLINAEATLRLQVGHPFGNGLRVAVRQFEQLSLQVGADQDVHGGRGRQHERAVGHVVGTGIDEVGEHAVFVAGAQQHVDRGAHALGVIRGQDVAEVAGGHAHVKRVAGRKLAVGNKLRVSGNVVHDLRQQAAPVNGVRA